MPDYLKEEGYIRLLQCFLQPNNLIQRKENTNSLTDQEMAYGKPNEIQELQVDPLHQLFNPEKPKELGMHENRIG